MTRTRLPALLFLALTACGGDATLDVAFRTTEPVSVAMRIADTSTVTSVVVEVLSIEASFVDVGWVVLHDEPQFIDLIALEDGSVPAVNDELVHPGHLDQLRLYLGDENTLVVDDETLPLTIPSGEQSGLKIPVDADLVADQHYAVDLRWPVQDNLVHNAQGWKLTPVLHVESFEEVEEPSE